MRIQTIYKNNIFAPKPGASIYSWCGDITLAAQIGRRVLRVQWHGRYMQNDIHRVDSATRVNIAPRFARWFGFKTYGRGIRTIAHFNIYKLSFSTFRNDSSILSPGVC